MDKFKSIEAKAKAGLSFEEVFASPEYQNILLSMLETTAKIAGYRRSTKLRVNIINDSDGDCPAYTNGEMVHINVGCQFAERLKKSYNLYNLFVVGLLAHEEGHILWTDFAKFNEANEAIKSGYIPLGDDLYDYDEEIENYSEYDEMLANEKIGRIYLLNYFHNILNLIEDIYVNAKQSSKFAGNYRKGIAVGNALIYEESPSIAEMAEMGLSKAVIYSNALVSKLKAKDVYYGTPEAEEEYSGTVNYIVSEIATMIMATPEKRVLACNLIICHLWKFIEEDIQNLKDKYDDEDNSDDGDNNSDSSDSSDSESSKSPLSPEQEKEIEEEIAQIMSGLQGQTEDTKDTSAIAQPSAVQKNDKSLDDEKSSLTEEEHEAMRKALATCLCDGSSSAGTVTSEDYTAEDVDFNSILNGLAHNKAVDISENAIEKELNDDIRGDYGIADSSSGATINRFRSIPSNSKKSYERIVKGIKPIANAMVKELERVIKDENLSESRKNRIIGKKLTTSKLYKPDYKFWEDRKNPKKVIDMAISVRVDESGSMYGDRIDTARVSCVLLKTVADELGIPIEIIGDTEDNTVELYPYCTFDSKDGNDKYRLVSMTDRWGNRDGYAIRFCYKRLKRRKEKHKLLIIISDGMPAADNYVGEAANNDLRVLTRQIKRDGTAVIAFGFGSDAQSLSSIYGKSFVCYEDLSKVPKAFAKVLKEQILRNL